MKVVSPLKNRKVTSGFRTRTRPKHDGTDYRAPKGTPLYAAIDGDVRSGVGHKNAGTWVEIDGANGVTVGYSHLDVRNVKSGAVRAGDVIGWSGSTGRAFGAHLHFYVRISRLFTNPEVWLKKKLQAPSKVAGKTTEDWLSRKQITALQSGLRLKFPAYRWSVKVKRGQRITVDGEDGPQTQAWVGEFQRRTGLKLDKIVGPKTVAMLAKHGINL